MTAAVEAPYLSTPFAAGQVVPFVDYDKGGANVAYHTTDKTNLGNSKLRSPDTVSIENNKASGNVVAYTTAGEWLNYTFDVPTAGAYTLQVSAGNTATGGKFHASVAGQNLTGSLSVPATGWYTFGTVISASFKLSAGTHVIQIDLDKTATSGAIGNFKSLELIAGSPVTPPSGAISLGPWKPLAPSPEATIEGGSIGYEGKLWVFGGFYDIGNGQIAGEDAGVWRGTRDSFVYDPDTNKWSSIAPMPDAETHEELVADGNYIYVAGGNLYDPKTTWQQFATTETWRYDITTNTWSAFTPLPQARGAGSFVIVGDTLHYFGGVNTARVPQDTHWQLDLSDANAQWTVAPSPPVARNHVATFSIGGKIYLMGGRSQGTDTAYPSSDCYVYDPSTEKWSQIASLPQILGVAAYAVVDGEAVVMGGTHTAAVPTADVVAYNPATNAWTELTPFPAPKIGPNGGFVDGMLIVTGGDDNGTDPRSYGAVVNMLG